MRYLHRHVDSQGKTDMRRFIWPCGVGYCKCDTCGCTKIAITWGLV